MCVHISLKTCEGSGDKSNVESSHMWGPTLLLQDVDVTVLILCGTASTASTATAVPKFDKWGLSRTKLGSEQFQYQPVLT